jgi:hypothetical protein
MTEELPEREDEAQGNDGQLGERSTAPAPAPAARSIAAADTSVIDLSREIAKTIARAVGERVTCRRISGNHYRCNWWMPHGSAGDDIGGYAPTVTTHRVSRSQMLHVTRTAKGLAIEPAR